MNKLDMQVILKNFLREFMAEVSKGTVNVEDFINKFIEQKVTEDALGIKIDLFRNLKF